MRSEVRLVEVPTAVECRLWSSIHDRIGTFSMRRNSRYNRLDHQGPVSLAEPVMSTRPLFIFVLSVLFGFGVKMLNGPLDRAILVRKIAFTAMIVAGVAIISLL